MLWKFVFNRRITVNGNGSYWPQIFAILITGAGNFSTAALYSWTSPSIPILTSNASYLSVISLEQASYFTVIPSLTAIILTPLISSILNLIGCKKTILLMIVLHALSWFLKIIATTLPILYLSSGAEGFSNGVMISVIPVYIGEVAQAEVRVIWGNTYPLFAYLGQFFINVVGSFYDIRTTAYIMICIPILQFLLVLFIPESPYFYLKRNQIENARNSLKILRWKSNVDEELNIIYTNIQKNERRETLKALFCSPINRKILIIVSFLRIFQQFSGVRTFFMYSQYIFIQTGSDISASMSAILYTGLFVLVIFIFNYFIGKFNRRDLLITSSLGTGFTLGIVGIYFYIYEKTEINLLPVSWIPLAGMILYIPFCSIGLGSLPPVIVGELFSLSIKNKAVGVTSIVYFIFIIVSSKIFQILSSYYGMYSSFCLFSLCCFPSAFFCYFFVPETRGKTLEEIQESLHEGK